jgi:nucleoside-diphosphate-sugar epimerase
MMHMNDCLEATHALMSAPRESLTRTTYNVTAISFTPAQLAEAIEKQLPGFAISYSPDFRWAAVAPEGTPKREVASRCSQGERGACARCHGTAGTAWRSKFS